MALYLTEKEAIGIYVDGLEKARSRSLEMMKSELSKQPKIFVEFIEALKRSAGAAHGLAHSRDGQQTRWLTMRDNLEKIIDLGQMIPTLSQDRNGLWLQISKVLDELVKNGKLLYDAKSISRADTLADLDQRLKKAPELSVNTSRV